MDRVLNFGAHGATAWRLAITLGGKFKHIRLNIEPLILISASNDTYTIERANEDILKPSH